MNIPVHSCTVLFKLFCEHNSFLFISRSGIAGSHANSTFNCLANCQTVRQSSHTIFHSHQQCVRVLISPCPRQHLLLSVFDYSHASGDTCCFMLFNMKLRYHSSAFLSLHVSFVSLSAHAFVTLCRLISVVVVHEEWSMSTCIFCRGILTFHHQTTFSV